MSWDDGLTGTTRAIAATDESPLRVIAGPGTGKSFALKRRVARLLEHGQDPHRVLAVTFTRNAARTLVDELRDLGVPGSESVRVGTLHSFCFSMLSRHEVLASLGRVPRPIVSFESSRCLQFEGAALLADLRRAGGFGAGRECTRRIHAFEAAWARLESETPGWPADPTDRQFQVALESWLHFHKAMLIGELVPQALRFVRNNPATQERGAFDHVLVDEYQDLNRAEQDFIDLLAENGTTVVVGDPDQSIYRFRYANPEGIDEFGRRHPATHDEILNECRRCPTTVVSIADHLIRQNHLESTGPTLQPMPGNPAGEVSIVQWPDINSEVEGMSEAIRWFVEDRGYRPAEILVLTPRRLLGYRIRNRLREAGVAVHSFYHEEALEGRSAQRAYCLLTLLVNPEDRVALRWWLGEDSGTWRVGPYERLRQYCERTGVTPRAALVALADGSVVIPSTPALVARYRELLATLSGLEGLSVADLIDALVPDGDDDCSVLRETALLNRDELTNATELLDRLRTHVTQPEMPEQGEFVRVMSLHKSKGLTSKVVVIPGCIEGLVPFRDDAAPAAEQDAVLREQRRLFYVAVTRCTEVLVVSSSLQMDRALAKKVGAVIQRGRGWVVRTVASRFLDELGPEAPTAMDGRRWAATRRAP